MNYQKIYNEIIENAISQNRLKNEFVYYERHHIVPQSLGGSNSKENLVLLTAKEHFICHLLLVKIYSCLDKTSYIKMCRAFNMMASSNNKHKRYINSRLFALFKEKMYGNGGILTKENSPFWGKTHSDEEKQRIKRRQTENNSMKGKQPWNFGKTKDNNEILKTTGEKISKTKQKTGTVISKEHRIKLSNALKGKKKQPFTEEHKNNISNAIKGKSVSRETAIKISEKTKGIKKEKIQCPHCKKIGGNGSMGRWHFDNCKEKT